MPEHPYHMIFQPSTYLTHAGIRTGPQKTARSAPLVSLDDHTSSGAAPETRHAPAAAEAGMIQGN